MTRRWRFFFHAAADARQRGGDLGSDGCHIERCSELGDLPAQLLHFVFQLRHAPRLATRTLPFPSGQGPGHDVVPHLL